MNDNKTLVVAVLCGTHKVALHDKIVTTAPIRPATTIVIIEGQVVGVTANVLFEKKNKHVQIACAAGKDGDRLQRHSSAEHQSTKKVQQNSV